MSKKIPLGVFLKFDLRPSFTPENCSKPLQTYIVVTQVVHLSSPYRKIWTTQ